MDVVSFYVFLFAAYGVPLKVIRSKPKLYLYRLFLAFLVSADVFAIIFSAFALFVYKNNVNRNVVNWELTVIYFICDLIFTTLSHLYVIFTALSVNLSDDLTNFLLFRAKNGSLSKFSSNLGLLNFIACFTCPHVYALLLFDMVHIYYGTDDNNNYAFKLGVRCTALYAFFIFYFQTHCCLFFSISMTELSASLLLSPNNKEVKWSRNELFMLNYERVKALSIKINRIFSPLLALTHFFSIVSISACLATQDAYTVLNFSFWNPFIILNFISGWICLKTLLDSNNKRLDYVIKMASALANQHPKPPLKRFLKFNLWLIETVMKDENFFDLGCCVPVDEALFITVIQTILDNCVHFTKYDLKYLKNYDQLGNFH